MTPYMNTAKKCDAPEAAYIARLFHAGDRGISNTMRVGSWDPLHARDDEFALALAQDFGLVVYYPYDC